MADLQVRSDAVDVEQIMRQIRSRIREKRGADYTEQEIQELASVKLEKFLDPRGVRSNLVQDFRRNRVITPAPGSVGIGDIDVFGSPRAGLRAIRKMLSPILRLFFSPTPLVHAVNTIQKQQNAINDDFHRRFRQREEMDPLYYEVVHNLVVELTRLSIENQNLKMRVESLASRVDFDERRARALETVVQYKPAPRPERGDRPAPAPQPSEPAAQNRQGGDDRQSSRDGNSQRNANQPRDGQQPRNPNQQRDGNPPRNNNQPREAGAAQDGNAGGEGTPEGSERGDRRKRRRRRRRPGQNGENRGQNAQGQPNTAGDAGGGHAGGAQANGDHGGNDGGRDDGGHENGDHDAGGDDGGADE